MSKNLIVKVVADPDAIDAAQWNRLLAASPEPTPFMRHEYLAALHLSGSATAQTGWQPQFLVVERADQVVAACPLYLKDHSYGEYVFDWAWADAYQRHGLAYYPKLLNAVPFTPVPGSRLLAIDEAHRNLLLRAMRQLCQDSGASSIHALFIDSAEQAAVGELQGDGWMSRSTVQFHWTNRQPGYADFADFLASLQREKRKKIQQERRRVETAGVHFTALAGLEITDTDWDFFYRCYVRTYREHHSTPYLTRDFFARVASTMAPHWLLFTAWQGDRRIAASLIALEPANGIAYGRYWGAIEPVSCLHFEACYYQPLQWCIDNGYQRFEGGAQGEHKMARGLLPVQTHSAHWLADPRFAQAVGDYLEREGAGVADYIDELNERRPFRDNQLPDLKSPA